MAFNLKSLITAVKNDFASSSSSKKTRVLLMIVTGYMFASYLAYFGLVHHRSSDYTGTLKTYFGSKESKFANGNNVVDTDEPSVNSTLGFEKILFMNVKSRWDLADGIYLQAAVSGLDIDMISAIPLDEITPEGMPLTSGKPFSSKPVASCYSTHARMWKKMLQNDWKTLFVLEADAAWDVNLRKQMGYFSRGFYDLLLKLGKIDPSVKPTNEDPFLSEYWDVFQFGGCFESDRFMNLSLAYDDPYAQKNIQWFDKTVISEGKRMIRYRGEQMCTTAYAVTRSGAEKLLLRAGLDQNTAVDGIFAEVVREGLIEQFSTLPMPVVQRNYNQQLSANDKNSDNGAVDNEAYGIKEETKARAFKITKEAMNVWDYSGMHGYLRFQHGAIFSMKNILYEHGESYL